MEWTDQDTIALQQFKTDIDSDDIKIKQQIKKTLLNNRFIVHVLNNEELEKNDASPEDYFNVNILPYYMLPDIQSNIKNFICYEVSYDTLNRYNSCIKILQVIFYVLVYIGGSDESPDSKNIIDKDTDLPRHDLLAALIQDQFNYTNNLGPKMKLVSDKAGTTDTKYALRTMVFEQVTDNNLVKSRTVDGTRVPFIANKAMVYPSEQV